MTHTIGIIGAGHLGLTLALLFRGQGIPDDHILISYGGNPATRDAIREAGFEENLAGNHEICTKSEIIFITIRPQSLATLKGLPFSENRLVVSCMAGVPTGVLNRRWGIQVIRMMPSGPETLVAKEGIVAVYPENATLSDILQSLGLKVYSLPNEEMMHVFTAGVCLPAAILAARDTDTELEVAEISRLYPLVAELFPWASAVLPSSGSDREREAYIAGMSTKGGITEAIVKSIRSGATFSRAFEAGINRSREISARAVVGF